LEKTKWPQNFEKINQNGEIRISKITPIKSKKWIFTRDAAIENFLKRHFLYSLTTEDPSLP